MINKSLKEDSRDRTDLPSLHGGDEGPFINLIANATGKEIDSVVYEKPIYKENIYKRISVLAGVKREVRKSAHNKYICLINELDEDEVEVKISVLRYSSIRCKDCSCE